MPRKQTQKELYDRVMVLFSPVFYEYDETIDWREVLKSLSEGRIKAVKTNNPKTIQDAISLISYIKSISCGITKEKMILMHGVEDGNKMWEEYRAKQSVKNTYEHKFKKYGMTREEFNEYNKSRAVTLENLIRRHGEEIGNNMWKRYIERQSFTNSKEHLGVERWKECNRKKAHTYDVYVERLGNSELAKQKLEEYYENTKGKFYSKKSQILFKELDALFPFNKHDTYYFEKNKEYCVYSKKNKRIYMYDYVCPELKLAIEFNGDHYHGNPSIYHPLQKLKGRGQKGKIAVEAWEFDDKKQIAIKEERGYDSIIVWESDFDADRESTIKRIIDYVIKRMQQL